MSSQSTSDSTCPTGTAAFSVTAAGSGPFTYQWQIADSTSPVGWLSIADGASVWDGDAVVHISPAEPYRCQFELFFDRYEEGRAVHCVVTNSCGSVTSNAATLTICDHLADLNCDAAVDLSDLATLLRNFGRMDNPPHAAGNLDGDEAINLTDLSLMLGQYGVTCP